VVRIAGGGLDRELRLGPRSAEAPEPVLELAGGADQLIGQGRHRQLGELGPAAAVGATREIGDAEPFGELAERGLAGAAVRAVGLTYEPPPNSEVARRLT